MINLIAKKLCGNSIRDTINNKTTHLQSLIYEQGHIFLWFCVFEKGNIGFKFHKKVDSCVIQL